MFATSIIRALKNCCNNTNPHDVIPQKIIVFNLHSVCSKPVTLTLPFLCPFQIRSFIQGDQNVSVHVMITVQKIRKHILNSFCHLPWFEDGHHRIHSQCGPCYTKHGLREQFGLSINVWRLAGDSLNITGNFLYCNHQVHRDFLNTLHLKHHTDLSSFIKNKIILFQMEIHSFGATYITLCNVKMKFPFISLSNNYKYHPKHHKFINWNCTIQSVAKCTWQYRQHATRLSIKRLMRHSVY
jgi:hypothetical protein